MRYRGLPANLLYISSRHWTECGKNEMWKEVNTFLSCLLCFNNLTYVALQVPKEDIFCSQDDPSPSKDIFTLSTENNGYIANNQNCFRATKFVILLCDGLWIFKHSQLFTECREFIITQTECLVEILKVALVCITIRYLLRKFATAFIVLTWQDFSNKAFRKNRLLCCNFYVAFDQEFSKNRKLDFNVEVNIVQNITSRICCKT